MAPSAGHVHSYVVRNVRVLKAAWRTARQSLQARLAHPSLRPQLQPVPIRSGQPVHPIAYLKQLKSRFYSNSVRNFSTSAGDSAPQGVKYLKSSFPKSRTGAAVYASTGRAPFASTLRPNLTGGSLGRTAGGYTLGSGRIGGARFFSHSPTAPAEVVQNVSQAVRAFFLSGQKAHYNGLDPQSGEKRFRAVTSKQDTAVRKAQQLPKATPGSYIDFCINPSITALAPIETIASGGSKTLSTDSLEFPTTLNTEGLLDVLSVDFSRALKDLAAILNDLKRLSSLGDLPVTYRSPSAIRIHFPGCDAHTVETICDELDVQRGIISQDEDFDSYVGTEIALLFPMAPSQTPSEICEGDDYEPCLFATAKGELAPNTMYWGDMLSSSTSNKFSTRSDHSYDGCDAHWDGILTEPEDNPWATSNKTHSGFETVSSDRAFSNGIEDPAEAPLQYQNFRSIMQFIQLCDANAR